MIKIKRDRLKQKDEQYIKKQKDKRQCIKNLKT